jgi:hypothetical protein
MCATPVPAGAMAMAHFPEAALEHRHDAGDQPHAGNRDTISIWTEANRKGTLPDGA